MIRDPRLSLKHDMHGDRAPRFGYRRYTCVLNTKAMYAVNFTV